MRISDALKAALESMQGSLEDVRAGRADWAPEWFGYERKQGASTFASEGEKSGERWRRLSQRYKAYKDRVRPSKKILQFDGRLRKSLSQRGRDRIERHGPSVFTFGTRVPYAAAHQHGHRGLVNVRPTTRTRGGTRFQVRGYAYRQNLPARPPVRKSTTQLRGLKGEMQRLLFLEMANRSRAPHRAMFGAAAAQMLRLRPRPSEG